MAAYPRDPNALAVLLKLGGASNMTPGPDAFVNKRRQQILGGEDELAPSELEQITTQRELGGTVSRDMIRDAGIQGLKQRLGLINAEAQAKLQPEIVKGEYGVKSARAAADAAEARRGANEAAAETRQERSLNAALERAKLSQGGQNTRQEDKQAFDLEKPPTQAKLGATQGTLNALQKARESYGSPMSRIGRMVGLGGSSDAFKGALANVLEQKGTLSAVAQAAQAVQNGEALEVEDLQWLQTHPNEMEYFKLLTGQ